MAERILDFSRLKDIINPIYWPLIKDKSRLLILKGGASSGKSKFAVQKKAFRLLTEEGHRFAFVRKVGRTIRESQFAELKEVIGEWNVGDLFKINQTLGKIACTLTGSEVISLGMDDREKIKSIKGITGVWYEEPTELEPRDFRQMELRVRAYTPYYRQSILTFNPISETHWLKEMFFPQNVEAQIEKTKYASLPVNIEIDNKMIELNAKICHSTYLDNVFLDAEVKAGILSLKEDDPHYYEIYGLGHWGSLGNLVYPDGFKIIPKSEYPKSYDEIIYGVDFGWIHPTAVVKVGIHAGSYYLEEKIYQKKLSNADLIKRLSEDPDVDKGDYFYCDNARPDFIDELVDAGFNAVPCLKGEGSVQAGIDRVRSSNIYTCPDNVGIKKELSSYKYQEDAAGNPIEGKVIKRVDDLMDAIRYPIFTHTSSFHDLHIGFVD